MNKIQSLTFFDELPITKTFRAKVIPDMNQEEKDILNREFQEALAVAKKEHADKRKQVGEENAKLFLTDPVSAVVQMYADKSDMWYLGEMLDIYGIGKVTMKRFGKGTFVGKNTMGEGTISNFHMKAEIGDQVLAEDVGSRNDRYSKAQNEVSTLGLLGSRIIRDYVKAHPERAPELTPLSHRLFNS